MTTEPHCTDEAPVIDSLLDTLSHPIRREVVYYFEQITDADSAQLHTLLSHLDDRMPSETEEQLHIKLVQAHLPKLAERGWLSHDRDTGRISYHGHERAGPLLDAVRDMF